MKNIIFDFGGVLLDWDPWRLYQTVFADRVDFEKFLDESRFLEMIERSDGGETFADMIAESETHAKFLNVYVTRALETLIVMEETVKIVEELKALAIPLYGLTNWSAETFPQVRSACAFFEHFEDIVVSGAERMLKPDPKFFELALTRWRIDPKQTLFIDDREENVAAARGLGLESILFENPEQLRQALAARLPEWPCTPN